MIRRYDHDEDAHLAEVLLESRGMSKLESKSLPSLGFIVIGTKNVPITEDVPIAMGFLRLVEGGFAQFDSYITNANTPSDIRDKALELLTEELIKLAKSLKLKKIVSYSQDKNTLMRSMRHGFVANPHTVIALDLSYEE